jgi:hypothetical protein
MGSGVIPEPHRTYVLELLKALGPAADEFVVAGAQAMKFALEEARGLNGHPKTGHTGSLQNRP